MDRKSMLHWGAKSRLLLLFCAPCCYAHSITLEGAAKLEDGQRIKGGTVIVYEYRDEGPGRMPKGRPLAVVVTDREGKFHAELADVQGPLDVRLVRDHCDWTGASTLISADDLQKKDRFEIALDATRERCEGRNP